MRITRKVFNDLAIYMVGFGLLIGVAFPLCMVVLGVPREIALTPTFLAVCLCAGALVGVINFGFARWVVGGRIRLLATSMSQVEKSLVEMTHNGDLTRCTADNCIIAVDSRDEIGDSALAFNHLVAALSTSMRSQAAIRSFSEMLTSQLEVASLAEHALRQFFEHTGAVSGIILYESSGELLVAATHGVREPELVADSDQVQETFRTGKARCTSIPEDVTIESTLLDFRPSEVLTVPVVHKKVAQGVVVLATAHHFDADQRARIELFMQGLALALNNAIAHEHLQRLAALDPLTGVYNRRFGLGRLHEEFTRAVRASTPLGVLMFDIDHFKAVNDTYGHLIGDRVLKAVAAIVRSVIREGDILLRYGGEEFVVVLPAASSDNLRMLGERLRKAVEDSSVADREKTVRVTVSVGGAALPGSKVGSEDELLQLADESLYRAKNSGRNRVELVQ